MKRIGITGPTGAGKTTALQALEELGALILDADAVYHRLLEENGSMCQALTQRFGSGILGEDGKLDRKKLGGVVFGDPAALEDLNGITHGFIGRALEEEMARAEEEGRPAAAIDAIALIESGLAAECEAVVGILAPAEVRVKRIMARDHIGEDYARARVAAQKDEAFYRAHCTHILENNENDTPETFRRRALELFRGLLEGD